VTAKLDFSAEARTYVSTSFGSTALVDTGTGYPAVFIHGVGQNAYFWRHQLAAFKLHHRCIAIDLMAHGYTEALPMSDVSFRQQAEMILAVLDDMGVQHFDLVMNDSGGAVGQLIAVAAPNRVRSMIFSNCDVHNNWPPTTFNEIRQAARDGKFADQIGSFIGDLDGFQATVATLLYENPSFVTQESIETNAGPIISSPERKAAFNRYVGMQDDSQLVVIEDKLRALQIPTLIVWGTADPFFPIEWAYWLQDALPLAQDVVVLEGAKLFFPEERPDLFNEPIAAFWSSLA